MVPYTLPSTNTLQLHIGMKKGEVVPKVKMTFGMSSVTRIFVNVKHPNYLSELGIRENLRYIFNIKSILKLQIY
jgi:hypothetical protein